MAANKKALVKTVIIAFVSVLIITGGVMGYRLYDNNRSSKQQTDKEPKSDSEPQPQEGIIEILPEPLERPDGEEAIQLPRTG